MPQDTAWLDNNGGYIIIPADADSISPEVKQVLRQFSADPRFREKEEKNNSDWLPFFYTIGILLLIWIIIRIRDGKSRSYVAFGSLVNNEADYDILENPGTAEEKDYLVYEGSELNFTDPEIITVLDKRSIYFSRLNEADKEKFIARLRKFLKMKTFFIHDKSGFKEMPILISAAAIQLSFGLTKYLLPDFPHIHIFPREFISTEPTIRFLEGNVSNNSINISWKHFLEGYNNPTDGLNVGLHEMAHAYYYQNVETPDNKDHNFVHTFSRFNRSGGNSFQKEQEPGNDLYSDYALKNFQEFWAESVEIYFEKPKILRSVYPDLYDAMCALLNQDPASADIG